MRKTYNNKTTAELVLCRTGVILMKCRILNPKSNQQELDRAIHISVACMMAAIADMGYCETSCRKIWDKAMLYINQVKDGALSIGEIFEMLEEDYNIKINT